MEIEEALNSGLIEFHPWRTIHNLPRGFWVPALCTDADTKQKADQPVDKPHCSKGKTCGWNWKSRRWRTPEAEDLHLNICHVRTRAVQSTPSLDCESFYRMRPLGPHVGPWSPWSNRWKDPGKILCCARQVPGWMASGRPAGDGPGPFLNSHLPMRNNASTPLPSSPGMRRLANPRRLASKGPRDKISQVL